MTQPRLTLRPPPNVEFIHGFPGIPPGAPDRPHASVRGAIELRIGAAPIKAKWVQIELRKVEVLPGGAQYVDYIGQPGYKVWQAKDVEFSLLQSQDFPFSIRIPESIPPSISLEKGAGIRYELMASVCIKSRKGLLRRESAPLLSTVCGIEMDKHELHSTWPIYAQPDVRHATVDNLTLTVERTHTCYGPGDKLSVSATLKSDSMAACSLRGFEFSVRETVIFRAGPTGGSSKKNLGPQVKTTIIGEQKVPLNVTLYGGMLHKAELGCMIPVQHTNTTVTTARHIDIGYIINVKALLDIGRIVSLDLPVTVSNWQRKESMEAVKRIGAPPAALEHPSRVHLIQQRMGPSNFHPSDPRANDPRFSQQPGQHPYAQQPGYPPQIPQQPGYAPQTPQKPGYPSQVSQQPGYPSQIPQQPLLQSNGPDQQPRPASTANPYPGSFGYQNNGKGGVEPYNEFGYGYKSAATPAATYSGAPSAAPLQPYGGYVPSTVTGYGNQTATTPGNGPVSGYFDTPGSGTYQAPVPGTQLRRPKSSGDPNARRLTIVNTDPTDNPNQETKYLSAEEEKNKLREADFRRLQATRQTSAAAHATSAVEPSILDSAPTSEASAPVAAPSGAKTPWPTAAEEKARLFEQAKANSDRVQKLAQNTLASGPSTPTSTVTKSTAEVVQPTSQTRTASPPAQQWPSAEEEKRRLFENAQAAVRQKHAQAFGSPTGSQIQSHGPSQSTFTNTTPSITHSSKGSQESALPYMSAPAQATTPPKLSVGAELYSRAMAQVKVNTPPPAPAIHYRQQSISFTSKSNAQQTSSSHLQGPTARVASSANAAPTQSWPTAEEEKATMRYEEAKRAVERKTGTSGGASSSASYMSSSPAPAAVPTGSSVNGRNSKNSFSSYTASQPLVSTPPLGASNKPRPPQDYAASLEPPQSNGFTLSSSPTPPPPSELPPAWAPGSSYSSGLGYSTAKLEKEKARLAYEAQDAAADGPPPPDYASAPTSPPPISPVAAGQTLQFQGVPLSAAQEKANLKAQYQREEATSGFRSPVSPGPPPISPGPRIMSPPPPPPPLLNSRAVSPPPTATTSTPQSQFPTGPPGSSALLTNSSPAQTRSQPLPPVASGFRHMSAAEEKAKLRAQYEAETATRSTVAPPAWSPDPVSPTVRTPTGFPSAIALSNSPVDVPTRDPSISLGKKRADNSTPPPLMPRPPVEYIQETRAEDARTSILGHGQDDESRPWQIPSAPWSPSKIDTAGSLDLLDVRPFSPLEVSLDHIEGSFMNGNNPPPLPPKLRLDST